MNIKKNLEELFRFIQRFGPTTGVYLYFKIKLGSQQNIKIPGIKFPFSLRKGTTDYETFYSVILHRQYRFNYAIIPETIIDGGANIGLASIELRNLFPDARIIAIEPDRENFDQLNRNIKPYKNIDSVRAGLWNKNVILKITDKYNSGKWAMITEEVDKENDETINAITIDKIMQDYKFETIDLLKLDIETAERELFSSGYSEWLPKVKMIIIELHDSMSKGTAQPFFKAINETFESYSFFQAGENSIIINEALINKQSYSLSKK